MIYVKGCRYCECYCPSIETPIRGICVAEDEYKVIQQPYVFCPFRNDGDLIDRFVAEHDLKDHHIHHILFYAVDSDGIRTPYKPSLDKLDEYLRDWGRDRYSRYAVYFDSDRHPFRTVCIKEVRPCLRC